ncbi:MAG: tRNA 2-thiouridine(34) synthase MnmA [Fibrobacteria bacterium]|nr:tRNA 2-thiouridine(34) synthase MnmA [Fibrobacteria bacterium]
MSGGVDSSVAALLRLREGARIVGLTMKLWDSECDGDAPDKACCTADHALDARRVCDALGAAHYTLDLRDEFRRDVVDVFVSEYLAGRTPNPCVRCNTYLKWDSLWSHARSLGCRFLSTGHYARVVPGPFGPELRAGKDPAKDQSYFLWGIPRDLLARTRFPLGELEKSETRDLAREAGLPTAAKSESQDICFVPGGDYRELVRRRAPDATLLRPGPIVGPDGMVMGSHEGLACYTLGQRRGIGVASNRPLYVAALEVETNTLRLGDVDDLLVRTLHLEQENWLLAEDEPLPEDIRIKLRYRSTSLPCRLYRRRNGATVVLEQPATAPAPGQSMVLYAGDRVLGGGVLARSE